LIRLRQRRRETADGVVPMINVAFLLLIFFLMAAVIAPPGPVEVSPPVAAGGEPGAGAVLVVTAAGAVSRGGLSGDAAFAGLAGRDVRVRADAALPGTELAKVLARLGAAGVAKVALVTVPE